MIFISYAVFEKVVLDSEFEMKYLFGFHNLMGVTTFEVKVMYVLCPQNPDAPLIQSLLFNLGVHLSSEVIDMLNDQATPEVSHTVQMLIKGLSRWHCVYARLRTQKHGLGFLIICITT